MNIHKEDQFRDRQAAGKAEYVFHDSDLPHQPTTGTKQDLDYLSREH
jgi:hypothetical protein